MFKSHLWVLCSLCPLSAGAVQLISSLIMSRKCEFPFIYHYRMLSVVLLLLNLVINYCGTLCFEEFLNCVFSKCARKSVDGNA